MSHSQIPNRFVQPVPFNEFLENLYKQWMDRETWCAVDDGMSGSGIRRRLAERRHYSFSNASKKSDLFNLSCSSSPVSFPPRGSTRVVFFPGERRQFPEQKNRSHLSRYMP